MMRALCLVLIALAAASCRVSTPEPPRVASGIRVPSAAEIAEADYGAYPSQYDAIIRAWTSAHLSGRRPARVERIYPPIHEHVIVNRRPVYGYAVCAEIDASGVPGLRGGMGRRWFFIRDDVVRRVRDPRGEIYIGRPYRCEEDSAEHDGG